MVSGVVGERTVTHGKMPRRVSVVGRNRYRAALVRGAVAAECAVGNRDRSRVTPNRPTAARVWTALRGLVIGKCTVADRQKTVQAVNRTAIGPGVVDENTVRN